MYKSTRSKTVIIYKKVMRQSLCCICEATKSTNPMFPFTSANNTIQRSRLLYAVLILIYFLLILSYGVEAQNNSSVTNVGAIINANSHIGKQQKIAMEIAAENFNSRTNTHKLILHFRDSGRDPFLAASAADELINGKKVKVIIGMETWQEAAVVADVGNRSQVPVVSFAAPSITPPLMQRRWPYLIRIASNASTQMKCIADIVSEYYWKRVVVIYEDDGYGCDVGMLALLSEALQAVGSRIEHRLVVPRVSSLSNPMWDELEELLKLPTIQCRVFIVLQSSVVTVTNIFRVAKKMGLVGSDSAWIITESITNLLDSLDSSDISTMNGTLGLIKTYDPPNTSSYANFKKEFQTKYSEEDDSTPGIYALQAYDMITIIAQAIGRMANSTTSLQLSLTTTLSNYPGLSGEMLFKGGEVYYNSSKRFQIINIVNGNRTYKEVGFPGSLVNVTWPGNSKRAPKGWAMPTAEKPMKIGVPGKTSFSKFVRVVSSESSDVKTYEGFCIEIFKKVLPLLNYSLPYEFEDFNGTYDELVALVHNKKFDAVVGDITVLAERMDFVEFTQPYMESGLSMIVPAKTEYLTWMFMKPFTWQLWVVTGAILIYTMLIVWFLESPSNPEFRGPLKNQIGTATWLTFSSLFFAHSEKIYSNLTRVVFIVWLFVVLILTSSYTANLSSMLTIQQLEPNLTGIDTNSKVGCDGDSFVTKYLQKVLGYNNIIKVDSENKYTEEFKSKNIAAAFLELPYAEVFMNEHCKGYSVTTPTYRFGGLSFIFQKGSPIARDFTKAILELLENGEVKKLQTKWLTPNVCSNNSTSDGTQSLSLENFAGLFAISGATSSFCFLLYLTNWLTKFQPQAAYQGNASPSNESLWSKTVRMCRFFKARQLSISRRAPTFAHVEEWSSPRWDYSTTSNSPRHLYSLQPAEIECTTQE